MAGSGWVMYSPSGLAKSQCRPAISTPARSAAARIWARRDAGDVFDAVGEGEGGDFDGFVPEIGRVVEDLFDGPVGEVLVAGGEFHI